MKKRAFTLIEIIIALALMSIVMLSVAGFLGIGFQGNRIAMHEIKFQSELRVAADRLNNSIRSSTVAFAVPQSNFESRKENWNYIGMEKITSGSGSSAEEHYEIVNYEWDSVNRRHKRSVIVSGDKETVLGMSFKMNEKENNTPTGVSYDKNHNVLQFKLTGVTKGQEHGKIEIKTEVQALNALVVEDGGSVSSPATALAYRNDPTPKPGTQTTEVEIAIALILDTSGSMRQDMMGRFPGNPGYDGTKHRMTIMKKKTNELIATFAAIPSAHISIIPFAGNANPRPFLKASEKQTELENIVGTLSASGGTNTGDGIRRAYHQLMDFANRPENSGKIIQYHMILLTDGNPTFTAVMTPPPGYYKQGTDWQMDGGSIRYIGGVGYDTDDNVNYSMKYIKELGDDLIVGGALDIKSYVIGFSGVPSNISRGELIAQYCNSTTNPARTGTYYPATSEESLGIVYQTITDNILKETWHIYGPY